MTGGFDAWNMVSLLMEESDLLSRSLVMGALARVYRGATVGRKFLVSMPHSSPFVLASKKSPQIFAFMV